MTGKKIAGIRGMGCLCEKDFQFGSTVHQDSLVQRLHRGRCTAGPLKLDICNCTASTSKIQSPSDSQRPYQSFRFLKKLPRCFIHRCQYRELIHPVELRPFPTCWSQALSRLIDALPSDVPMAWLTVKHLQHSCLQCSIVCRVSRDDSDTMLDD